MNDTVTITTPHSWFDHIVNGDGRKLGNVKKRGFTIRAAIGGYKITPRDKTFEFFLNLGKSAIIKVLFHKLIGRQHLLFVLPERWMSIHEQSQFIPQLECHPDVMSGLLTQVDIVTQNSLMVSNFYDGELAIFNMDGSEGFTTGELQQISAPSRKKLDERRKNEV